jgi:hypothetical protein
MPEQPDFETLVQLASDRSGGHQIKPVIRKEILHYDILYALDQRGLLDSLVFQGGTALRLCYGSQRLSEDLDFAGGRAFTADDAHAIKQCVEHHIGKRYGLDVRVKEPKALRVEGDRGAQGQNDVTVDKWQISVQTSPSRPDLPSQRIKLEIANVATYESAPCKLIANYDFLPNGYGDLLVPTESPTEIATDKMVSLVNNERYIRHRDIWDLEWLSHNHGEPDMALLRHKIDDYNVRDYADKARAFARVLPAIVESTEFQNTMRRFVPAESAQRTLDKPKYREYLAQFVGRLLIEAADQLDLDHKPSADAGPDMGM